MVRFHMPGVVWGEGAGEPHPYPIRLCIFARIDTPTLNLKITGSRFFIEFTVDIGSDCPPKNPTDNAGGK